MKYTYHNGNTTVTIDTETGTKERYTDEDKFISEFAESIDCTITYKCNQNCKYCYAGCTTDGNHADLHSKNVKKFIDSLQPYTELALNGNDLDTPGLVSFLIQLSRKHVITNITVHQDIFVKEFEKLQRWSNLGWIHGIGVSVSRIDNELAAKISQLPNTVLHIVLGTGCIQLLDELSQYDNFKILLLGYKNKGRGIDFYRSHCTSIHTEIENLQRKLKNYINKFSVVSFDNLAIEQLEVKRLLTPEQWDTFYMGDEGSHTFFVDLVKGVFARDSLTTDTFSAKRYHFDSVKMFKSIQPV